MRKAASSAPTKIDRRPLALPPFPPPHSLTFPPGGNQAGRLVQNRWINAPPSTPLKLSKSPLKGRESISLQ